MFEEIVGNRYAAIGTTDEHYVFLGRRHFTDED